MRVIFFHKFYIYEIYFYFILFLVCSIIFYIKLLFFTLGLLGFLDCIVHLFCLFNFSWYCF